MFKNLALLLVSLGVALFVGEVAVRTFVDEVNYLRPQLVRHPDLGHAIAPASAGHDEWGFRNRKVPDRADIVAIGDSQTYGYAATADDNWPSWLARLTGKDVYNLGIAGYGPIQYGFLFENYAVKLKPDIVLFGVYLGNDLADSYHMGTGGSFENVQFHEGTDISWTKSIRNWLAAHSILYQMSKTETYALFNYVTTWEKRLTNDPRLQEDSYVMINGQPIFLSDRRRDKLDIGAPEMTRGFEITLEVLGRVGERCRMLGLRCIFVIIPTKEAVYWPVSESQLSGDLMQTLGEVVALEVEVRQKLMTFFETRGFEFADPLATLQENAKHRVVYPWSSPHPNSDGYRVLAESVAARL